MAFAKGLTEEERRAAREGLDQEALAIFHLPIQPEPVLDEKQKDGVKNAAKALLTKLKAEVLVDDWRVKMQARAAVESAIWSYCRKLPAPYASDFKRSSGSAPIRMCTRTTSGRGRVFTRRGRFTDSLPSSNGDNLRPQRPRSRPNPRAPLASPSSCDVGSSLTSGSAFLVTFVSSGAGY